MAYFKLMLMKPIHTTVDSNLESKYLLNTISEFYSQEEEHKNNKENLLNSEFSFCYTYNEKFSIHKHHQKELTFSMNQMILYNDNWINNPFAQNMMIGTKLCLEDKYHEQHLFTVKDISYEIKENNRILNVTCQDSFSYQMSRQNEGYEIVNDNSAADFIGSKNLDWWVYFKIQPECHIPYVYIPLYVGLYEYELLKIKEQVNMVDGTPTYQPITQELKKYIEYFTDNNEITRIPNIESFIENDITYQYRYEAKKIKRIIKPIYNQEQYPEYYETFPFSVSGSNANAALISLAETMGLMLNIYESQTENKQQFRKYFWIGPDKQEKNNGLYYSPNLDIQNFSFSQAGDSLVTVLNVNGPTIDDEIITLIPEIPPFFLEYFMTKEWQDSEYYPGFYTDVCQGETYSILESQDEDRGFKIIWKTGESVDTNEIDVIIEDGDILIPIELPVNEFVSWYDKVSFAGSELELRFNGAVETKLYYPEQNEWLIEVRETNLTTTQNQDYNTMIEKIGDQKITHKITTLIKEPRWELSKTYCFKKNNSFYFYKLISFTSEEVAGALGGFNQEYIFNLIGTNNKINNREHLLTNMLYEAITNTFDSSILPGVKTPNGAKTYLRLTDSQNNNIDKIQVNSAKIYMRWFRDVSDDELKFASIADQCPWLENKLIDFSYFSQHELITPNDENLLKNTINNNLRKVNGQLMQYTKSYYDALHSRTENIAKLTNSLDLLGAEMEASIYSPYSKEGDIKESDFESVYETYNAIWIPQQQPKTILNYGELMTEYFNKYFSAQQRFLKNIYNFRSYWNKPIGFAGTGIYENKVTVTNMNDNSNLNIILFGDLTWKKINSNFNLYRTGEFSSKIPLVNLYSDSYNFEKIDIINEYNYTNFYTPTVKANAWTKCNEESKLLPEVFYAEINDANLDENGKLIENATYKQMLYTDIVERYLGLSKENIYNYSNYYYRKTPYYHKVSDAKWFTITPTDNNPQNKWQEFSSSVNDNLQDIYNRDVLSHALTLHNYNKDLAMDVLGEWVATTDDEDDPNSKDAKWSHIYKSYIQGFPIDKLYWYGTPQTYKNASTFDENVTYYTTWENKKKTKKSEETGEIVEIEGTADAEYLPVAFITPKNYNSYFKRVARSEKSYNNWSWTGIVYLLTRWKEGYLAQDGACFRVLDGQEIGIDDHTTFEAANKDYTNWIRLIYGTDKNSDKLIKQYKDISSINEYYKFWQWVAPTYSVLTTINSTVNKIPVDNRSLWYFSNSEDDSKDVTTDATTANLCFKEKSLRILNKGDIINNQDKYLMLPITTDSNNCLFNFWNNNSWETPTAATIKGKLSLCCYETSKDSNNTPIRISAVTHYPLYNYCIGLQVQFENDAVCSSLEDYLESEGSFENGFDYLFKVQIDGSDLYVVFFQLEDFERINIESTDDLRDIINNYYIYDKKTDLPVNFYEIKGLTNGLYSQAKKDGNYKTFAELSTTWEDAKKQEFYKKVDEEQEIYKRVYLLDNYLEDDSKLVAYYQTADSYTETVFNNKINTITPPIYLCQRELSNEVLTTTKITKYNKEIKLDFSDGLTKDNITIIDENGINYILKYSCAQNTKTTFGNMTNGTFWYKYHTYDQTQPLLFEYAALIETQLTEYWTSAYAASQYIEYFIPEFWQRTSAQAVNNFYQHLIYYNGTEATLSNDFIPEVSIYFNPITNTSVLPRYNLSYIEDVKKYLEMQETTDQMYSNIVTNNFYSAYDVLINNDAVLNAFSELGWNANELNNWQAEKVGENEYGQTYYYVNGDTGKKRNRLPQDLAREFRDLPEYNGLYIMLIRYLYQYYNNKPMEQYYNLQKAHDNLWHQIYQEYPGLLLEGNYTNEDAIDSKDLLFLAKNAFKDLSNPERNYSLTFIDIHSLRGYEGQKLAIGDSIQLDINDYIEEYGDLSQALSQFLFISDISYDLRKDSDINLTVNIIKYQDKLIQRLAKLIK